MSYGQLDEDFFGDEPRPESPLATPIKRRQFGKRLLQCVAAAVPIAGVTAFVQREKILKFLTTDAEIQRAMASLLAQEEFSGEEFRRQLLGSAELARFFVDTEELQFLIPKKDREKISAFLRDPANIREVNETFEPMMFTTDLSNFHVDTERQLTFPYKHANYTVTPRELTHSIGNHDIQGGRLYALTGKYRGRVPVVTVNHGAYVANPGNPSIQRFADEVLKDIPPEEREKRIQRLLDVVTTEIAYDGSDASWNSETMKRAPETLMTRKSDCSNKVILFSSLLQQIQAEHLLMYMPQHIAVAVEQGNFEDKNASSFSFEGKTWALAETTASQFEIGKSLLASKFNHKDIEYLQPSGTSKIISTKTGQPLMFQ